MERLSWPMKIILHCFLSLQLGTNYIGMQMVHRVQEAAIHSVFGTHFEGNAILKGANLVVCCNLTDSYLSLDGFDR
jgi:hypothetical protein